MEKVAEVVVRAENEDIRSKHVTLLNMLNKSGLSKDAYHDKNVGPLKPGFAFYKLLSSTRGPSLQMNIPDTILGDNNLMNPVKRIFTGDDGFIQREKINSDSTIERDKFVMNAIDRIISNAKPLTKKRHKDSYGKVKIINEPLQNRIVAVSKRCLKSPKVLKVSNQTDVLTPLPFKALLLQLSEKETEELAIQQFIRPRGTRATVYRIFWRSMSIGAGTVTGYRITKSNEEFTVYDDSTNFQHNDDSKHNSSEPVVMNDDEYSKHIKLKPEMSLADRKKALRQSLNENKTIGSSCLCSLSDEKGDITSASAAKVLVTRVSSDALDELRIQIDKLVNWIQVIIQRTDHLVMYISELICDFIRDENGKWWFIQIKGFEINDIVKDKIKEWYSLVSRGLDTKILSKGRSADEIRQKLEKERGFKCKMCGRNFQQGQVVNVEILNNSVNKSMFRTNLRGKYSQLHNLAGHDNTRMVPAYGYILSTRSGCTLAEVYRDSKIIPLTKFARHLLTTFSDVVETRTLSERTQIYEAKDHTDISCCFFCVQIHEEISKFHDGCVKLGTILGSTNKKENDDLTSSAFNDLSDTKNPINVKTETNMTLFKDETKVSEIYLNRYSNNIQVISNKIKLMVKSAEKQRKTHTKGIFVSGISSLKSSTSASNDFINPLLESTESLKIADIEGGLTLAKWKSSHFKRQTVQYRVLFIAYFLSGASIPTLMDGSIGCLSFCLGQSTHTLFFHLNSNVGDYNQNDNAEKEKIIRIKQCRLLYLCACPHDAKSLFAEKEIELYWVFTPHVTISSTNVTPNKPTVEGSTKIKLSSIDWYCDGCNDGTYKLDFTMPVYLESFPAPLTFHYSIAIVKDEILPSPLANVLSFLKEKEVFWPPSSYIDDNLFPESWISMLYNENNQSSRYNFGTAKVASRGENAINIKENDEQVPTQEIQAGDSDDGNTDGRFKSDLNFVNYYSHFMRIGEANGVEMMKRLFIKLCTNSESKVGCVESNNLTRFSGIFSGNNNDNASNSYDDDDDDDDDDEDDDYREVNTYQYIQQIFSTLKDPSISGDKEFILLTTMALEQLLLHDSLPGSISWSTFKTIIQDCYSWAKIQRQKVHLVCFDETKERKHNSDKTSTAISNTFVGRVTENFTKHDTVLSDISIKYRNTELDFSYNRIESLYIDEKRFSLSSPSRKKRRLSYALEIVDTISKDPDMIDVAELRSYLFVQREQLKKVLDLVKDGAIKFPLIRSEFSSDMKERSSGAFSIVIAIICTLLLTVSPSLSKLFDTYNLQGAAYISTHGFLKAFEECFVLITSGHEIFDPTILYLKSLTTEAEVMKRHQASLTGQNIAIRAKVTELKVIDDENIDNCNEDDTFSVLSNSKIADNINNRQNVNVGTRKKNSKLVSARRASSVTLNNVKKIGPPTLFACCEVHGNEHFYLADICCTTCEKESYSIMAERAHQELMVIEQKSRMTLLKSSKATAVNNNHSIKDTYNEINNKQVNVITNDVYKVEPSSLNIQRASSKFKTPNFDVIDEDDECDNDSDNTR